MSQATIQFRSKTQHLGAALLATLATLCIAETSAADEGAATLGLSPGAPQITSLPGGVTPSFGKASTQANDWRFDFHGLVLVPLRVGVGKRLEALEGQKVTTLHAPPRIPERFEAFEYSSVILDPWVQLNFSYGNKDVTATVIVASRSVNTANAFFDPPDHIGVNDAFLTFRLPVDPKIAFTLDVGAFANSYGNMGEYDLGKYGTPLLFRLSGAGFTARGDYELGHDLTLATELGMKGQLNKAPVGVEPAGWNGFADPNTGSSFAAHGHALVDYQHKLAVGLHFADAFVQDDRATPLPQNPDGNISVVGADARLTLGPLGHLYAGFAHTAAETARAVSGVIRVLNAPGGPGLMQEYFGADSNNGTGAINAIGAQYDFSLGHYLRRQNNSVGPGPDVVASLFGIYAHVSSDDKSVDDADQPLYDGVGKLKYGTEVSYSFVKWLAAAMRYDRILPDLDNSDRTHAILSPRLIFHSDWGSQDQVVLQYSHWFTGSQSTVFEGYPLKRDPTVVPDADTVMLSASMWW
jgi:hypothetical protein